MKLIIAGSRHLTDKVELIDQILRRLPFGDQQITEVVSGCARGIDTEGERWANRNNIPIKRFPADWDKYGRSAGPIRNQQMAKYADALLLIWDGQSPGSRNMLQVAEDEDLTIINYVTRKPFQF